MGRAERRGWAGDGGDGAPRSSRTALQTLRGSWCCPMAATALSAFAGLWLSSVLFSSCSSGHLHHPGSSPSVLHWRHPDLPAETEPPPPPEPPPSPLHPCATLCALPSPHMQERNIQLLPKPRVSGAAAGSFPPLLTGIAIQMLQTRPAPRCRPHPAPSSSCGCLKGPFPPENHPMGPPLPSQALAPAAGGWHKIMAPLPLHPVVFLEETSVLLGAHKGWMRHTVQGNRGQEA